MATTALPQPARLDILPITGRMGALMLSYALKPRGTIMIEVRV